MEPKAPQIFMKSAATSTDPVPLEVHDLTVAYHKKPVLYGIDLTVPAGSIIGIIGPNGAGKSTLFSLILKREVDVH